MHTSQQNNNQNISGAQLEQVKSLVKDHLEKHKFFDTIKSAVAKDPNLGKLDRNQIIEKLKSEGILGDIISTMPVKRNLKASGDLSASDSLGRAPAKFKTKALDPNKRYLSCNITCGRAFVDFVNPRDDEYISMAVSFLKNRFHTKHVRAGCEFNVDETFIFEFEGEYGNSKFDSSMMLKLNQPLHLTILRHRKSEKPIVLGTKNLDWRSLLFCNSVEINAEVQPVDLTHKGALGVVQLNLDLVPNMMKSDLLGEEIVNKQIELEKKYDQETLQKFLEYANNWWSEYKEIRPSHKSRLVKIFAETDDREASVYKPTCSLIQPMYADRILDSPLHAARFVSLIPFQRLEAPGAEKVEIWHSMQSFLARGCGDSEDHAVLLCNLLIGFGLDAYVCVGTNGEGSHAWVLQRLLLAAENGVKQRPKVIFWEALTGQKMAVDDPRVHRFYRQIGCVFNHQSFFANVQQDDRVSNVSWDFEDEYMWKAMSRQMINGLQPANGVGYLMPSHNVNIPDEEKTLEKILREKIAGIRRNDGGNLNTAWDNQLSYLLQTALSNYEFERISGSTFANEEFQASIKNHVPEGHTFKAFPIQFTHFDTERMIHHIYANKVGKEIMMVRGSDQVKHAVRVKVVTYPENVSAVWVILAVRFRSVR